MSKFTVIMELWTELPHLKLGDDLSRITGIHKQTIFTRLRKQDGIICEGLEKETADEVAEFLTGNGFPATSIPDSAIFPEWRHRVVRNADVVENGFEIEDPYGKKELIGKDKVNFVHIGWVEEHIEASEGTAGYFGLVHGVGQGVVEGPGWKPKSMTENTGWVMHIFWENENGETIRIFENKFNYDYQGDEFIPPDQRFISLLRDLIGLLPVTAMDSQIEKAIKDHPDIHSAMRYSTLKDLEDRVRWRMTLRWR